MASLRTRFGSWIGGISARDTFFGVNKPTTGRRAMVPEWYFVAPYGQPRNVDITKVRTLSESPFIQSCVSTIVDEFAQAKWSIIPKDKDAVNQEGIDIITEFLNNPNKNKETLVDIRRQWCRDLLITDAAVIVKSFSENSYEGKYNKSTQEYERKEGINVKENKIYKSGEKKGQMREGEGGIKKFAYAPLKPQYSIDPETGEEKFLDNRTLTEIYCRDGSTFLADGDYTGYIHRWLQYSPILPFREPFLFDRDEILYTMRNPRSYSFYGWSAVQDLESVILTMKAQVKHFEGQLKEKGVPDGVLFFEDAGPAEMKRLRDYWQKEVQGKQHKLAIIGRKSGFASLQVTSKDMELLTSQQWFMKLAMSRFDLNIPILSMKGEAPRAGTEALVKRERRKAVMPIMALWEMEINNGIIKEFGFDDVEFKFDTFDLEEARVEREMYVMDIESGLRSINEIRTEDLGLDKVEWGDEPKSQLPNPMMPGVPGQPKKEEEKSAFITLREFRESEIKRSKVLTSLTEFKKEIQREVG